MFKYIVMRKDFLNRILIAQSLRPAINNGPYDAKKLLYSKELHQTKQQFPKSEKVFANVKSGKRLICRIYKEL